MIGRHIKLLTRNIGTDDRPSELVVAIQIGDKYIDLIQGTPVKVEHYAGTSFPTVTVTLPADTVRYEPAAADVDR